ncbi:Hypothetical_protein [Hexamita inflata]|uniref:Hypothetical_protein n=1 Tax=Hexamita inflata TaxID=28002 RepID=A0AA86U9U3_9EUKA|nr:Hypothetical protein HINF_LOCUS22173 [Hexamita inflata]
MSISSTENTKIQWYLLIMQLQILYNCGDRILQILFNSTKQNIKEQCYNVMGQLICSKIVQKGTFFKMTEITNSLGVFSRLTLFTYNFFIIPTLRLFCKKCYVENLKVCIAAAGKYC